MLKAVWKGTTRKGTHVYLVKGSESEIEEYIDNNGSDTLFNDDDETKPLFFTRTLTKQGNLIWNEEDQRYRVEITFESAVLMEAAKQTYSATDNSSSTSKSEDEDNDDSTEEAVIEPTPKKKSLIRKK
jgi:hypothetical protein